MRSGHENLIEGPGMARVIADYAECRSFNKVAAAYGLARPSIRKCLSIASAAMLESLRPEERALSAYIGGLIFRANPHGKSPSIRFAKKAGNVERTDPSILGEFRLRIGAPGFEDLWTIDTPHARRGILRLRSC